MATSRKPKTGGRKRATAKKSEPEATNPRRRRRQDGKAAHERYEFDERQLRALCRIHATDEEMAAVLGCSTTLIGQRRAQEPWFKELEAQERSLGRASHRRNLHLLAGKANQPNAPKGAITALIFIAKQPEERGGLGWADRVDSSVTLPQLDPSAARAMLANRLTALGRARKAKKETKAEG